MADLMLILTIHGYLNRRPGHAVYMPDNIGAVWSQVLSYLLEIQI